MNQDLQILQKSVISSLTMQKSADTPGKIFVLKAKLNLTIKYQSNTFCNFLTQSVTSLFHHKIDVTPHGTHLEEIFKVEMLTTDGRLCIQSSFCSIIFLWLGHRKLPFLDICTKFNQIHGILALLFFSNVSARHSLHYIGRNSFFRGEGSIQLYFFVCMIFGHNFHLFVNLQMYKL